MPGASMRIEDVRPVHVAGYIEQLQALRKAPTVKQHLACIRMLFDWLVTGQVIASNPAHAVRGATALRHQGRDHGDVLPGNDGISQKH
jgi:site-specific recombinase XerC